MANIKLQGPTNFGGFSHDGQSYQADDDGIIEVPAHIPAEVIAAHGLTQAEEKPKKVLAKGEAGKKDEDGKGGK